MEARITTRPWFCITRSAGGTRGRLTSIARIDTGMAQPLEKQMIIGSLFDRLTDEAPRNSREILPPEREQRERHKASGARDLPSLLNTRRSETDTPEELELGR